VVYSCFQNEWIPVWFLYGFSNCLLTYLIQKKSFVIILWNSLLQEFAYSVTSLAVQSDFNIDGILTYLIQKKSFVIILWNSLLQEFAYSVTSLAVQSDFNIDGILTYLKDETKNVNTFCLTVPYSQFPNHGEAQLWILIIWWNDWDNFIGNSSQILCAKCVLHMPICYKSFLSEWEL
jgi:hypothetical protein